MGDIDWTSEMVARARRSLDEDRQDRDRELVLYDVFSGLAAEHSRTACSIEQRMAALRERMTVDSIPIEPDNYIDIVFDGEGPNLTFVDIESSAGRSIWVDDHERMYKRLRIRWP